MAVDEKKIDEFRSTSNVVVPEDLSRLVAIEPGAHGIDADLIVESLKQDLVVLVRNAVPEQGDLALSNVATKLGLGENLKLQAGFASFLGHRQNVGKFFMTVNKRDKYQHISPHSEGSTFSAMQLASFYCFENSTDGGETIVMNVNESSNAWGQLREQVTKVGPGSKMLNPRDAVRAKALYRLRSVNTALDPDEQVLRDRPSDIPGLKLVEVLARLEKVYSSIAGRELYVYWDTVSAIDFDSAKEYSKMLREDGLLRQPPEGLSIDEMDSAAPRRVWSSGTSYADLFLSAKLR